MLTFLVTAALLLAPAAQDPAQKGDQPPLPDPAQVEEAVNRLEEAFKKGKTAERLEALSKFGKVNDAEVIKWVSRGLRDKETTVCSASIEVLRMMKHPDALDALHKSFTKDKKIKKDDALHQAMIKAIGQHGNVESIDTLTDGALASVPRQVQVARIYSLGNIRDTESVEALMDLMQKTGRRGGKRGGGGGQPMMGEFRTSLRILTGQDFKSDVKAWSDWWKENERDFEITDKPVGLSKKEMSRWNKYWGVDQKDKKKTDKEKGRGKRDA
jgi:hypothetical protein